MPHIDEEGDTTLYDLDDVCSRLDDIHAEITEIKDSRSSSGGWWSFWVFVLFALRAFQVPGQIWHAKWRYYRPRLILQPRQ